MQGKRTHLRCDVVPVVEEGLPGGLPVVVGVGAVLRHLGSVAASGHHLQCCGGHEQLLGRRFVVEVESAGLHAYDCQKKGRKIECFWGLRSLGRDHFSGLKDSGSGTTQ